MDNKNMINTLCVTGIIEISDKNKLKLLYDTNINLHQARDMIKNQLKSDNIFSEELMWKCLIELGEVCSRHQVDEGLLKEFFELYNKMFTIKDRSTSYKLLSEIQRLDRVTGNIIDLYDYRIIKNAKEVYGFSVFTDRNRDGSVKLKIKNGSDIGAVIVKNGITIRIENNSFRDNINTIKELLANRYDVVYLPDLSLVYIKLIELVDARCLDNTQFLRFLRIISHYELNNSGNLKEKTAIEESKYRLSNLMKELLIISVFKPDVVINWTINIISGLNDYKESNKQIKRLTRLLKIYNEQIELKDADFIAEVFEDKTLQISDMIMMLRVISVKDIVSVKDKTCKKEYRSQYFKYLYDDTVEDLYDLEDDLIDIFEYNEDKNTTIYHQVDSHRDNMVVYYNGTVKNVVDINEIKNRDEVALIILNETLYDQGGK